VSHLLIEPELARSEHRLTATTPLFVRALYLFSYRRLVTIDRRLEHVRIDTRRFWLAENTRIVALASIERVVCEAQALPTGFSLWRFFYSQDSGLSTDLAMFYIALRLRDARGEVPLFTLIESQPGDGTLLERLAGDADDVRVGDEGVTRFLAELNDALGLPRRRSAVAS